MAILYKDIKRKRTHLQTSQERIHKIFFKNIISSSKGLKFNIAFDNFYKILKIYCIPIFNETSTIRKNSNRFIRRHIFPYIQCYFSVIFSHIHITAWGETEFATPKYAFLETLIILSWLFLGNKRLRKNHWPSYNSFLKI